MRLEDLPGNLWLDTFLEVDKGIGQRGSAQPLALGDPFVYFLKISIQNLGSKSGDKGLCKFNVLGAT